MSRIAHTLVALFAAGAAAGAAAQPIMLTATLTNAQEGPTVIPTTTTGAPRPASFGNATFQINDAHTSMSFSATVFNIDFTGTQTADTNDNLTNAHIHASPTAVPGTTAPVVWGFIGTPFNDNNPNDVVFTPFATGVGGTVSGKWDAPEGNSTTFAAQLGNILAGHSYINFHTSQFPSGEVRGQILAVTAVPEPQTTALVALGLGMLAFWTRRRAQPSTRRAPR
ncbi:MAG TPA: CHRD domain-containing protein [Caldimonas sp.]|nr:CHRD domain-containing protein [Caldimonas sp.]